MAACSAYGCTNRFSKKIPGITFHRFPSNPGLLEKWVKAIRRENWMPSKHSRLCSAHFQETDINRTLSRVQLKEDAVPSIFESFPSYYQTVCELHFKKSEIETEASAYDSKTGRTITAPLGVKRLKKGAIPSLLIPKLNSESSIANRENPEEKRIRIEKEQLSLAVEQSLKSTPDETSSPMLPKDAAESDLMSSLPTLRQTGDKVETQQKKGKRKRKMEKEVTSSKKMNGICDSDSVDQCQSIDVQEISENHSSTVSRIDLSESATSFQMKEVESTQQNENSSLSQMSSSLNSANTGITENVKNNQVQIKEEKPWEVEYGLLNSTCRDGIEGNNNMVKIVNVESSSSIETAGNTSQQMETKDGCDTSFYKKPLKIDKRDEAFGKLVTCEMSDLRGNPELYLRTQQSILKLLVEAHFEQMSSVSMNFV